MSLYTGIHVVLSDLNRDQVIGSHDSPNCLSKIFTSAADKLSFKKNSFREKFCKKMHDSNMYTRMKYNEDNTAQWYI